MISRRGFLKTTGTAIAAASLANDAGAARPGPARERTFCLFSKHLPELRERARKAVKEAGFDGVDLTVRAQGHVLPEKAADDLPRAVEAITARGQGADDHDRADVGVGAVGAAAADGGGEAAALLQDRLLAFLAGVGRPRAGRGGG